MHNSAYWSGMALWDYCMFPKYSEMMQAVCAMYHTCEKECGAILFWQYMASIVCIPVWMIAFLSLMSHFHLM